MRKQAILPLALVASALLAAAGCLDLRPGPADFPPGRSEAGLCADIDGGATASGNAPVYDAFRGQPLEVAIRFAEAIRDPVARPAPNAERSTPEAIQWDTTSGGSVTVRRSGGGLVGLDWIGRAGGVTTDEGEARGWLNETLERFGVPPDSMLPPENTNPGGDPHLMFRQGFNGSRVEGTGGTFTPVTPLLTLWPSYDLTNATVNVSRPDAEDMARQYVRCELDEAGHTREAGYRFNGTRFQALSVAEQSLAYTLFLAYTEPAAAKEEAEAEDPECELVYAVEVDAATGAVLGWGRPPCD